MKSKYLQVFQYHSGILHRLLRLHEQFLLCPTYVILYVWFKDTDLRSAFYVFINSISGGGGINSHQLNKENVDTKCWRKKNIMVQD